MTSTDTYKECDLGLLLFDTCLKSQAYCGRLLHSQVRNYTADEVSEVLLAVA